MLTIKERRIVASPTRQMLQNKNEIFQIGFLQKQTTLNEWKNILNAISELHQKLLQKFCFFNETSLQDLTPAWVRGILQYFMMKFQILMIF